MILATGATGNTGSQVVRELTARGASVRAFVRDPEKAEALFGEDVELAVGDFSDPASFGAALDGVEEVLLSCADDPRRVEWETRAIDAAAGAGVRRVVKLSTVGAEPGAAVAFWDWHGRVEQHLRSSPIPSVILRSSFYMSNLFAAADQIASAGRLYAPAGDARIAMIDPRDVGAAAAAVLTSLGHEGQTYVITGPEAITYAQVAADLSAATRHEVEFVDVPEASAKDEMIAAGVPDFVADQVVAIFALLRQGLAEQVTDTVEALTGARPRSLSTFARDHARLFAGAPVPAP